MRGIIAITACTFSIHFAIGRDVIVQLADGFATEPARECVLYNANKEKMPTGVLGKKNDLTFSNLAVGKYCFVSWSSSVAGWTESPRYDVIVVVDKSQGEPVRISVPEVQNEVRFNLESPIDLKPFFPGFTEVPCRVQRYRDGAPEVFGFRWIWFKAIGANQYTGTAYNLEQGTYVLSVPFFLTDELKAETPSDGVCLIASPFEVPKTSNSKVMININVSSSSKSANGGSEQKIKKPPASK